MWIYKSKQKNKHDKTKSHRHREQKSRWFFLNKQGFHIILMKNVFQILHWVIKMLAKFLVVLYRADGFSLWLIHICNCLFSGA